MMARRIPAPASLFPLKQVVARNPPTKKMLKMKVTPDELLKTKGQKKYSGWLLENKGVISFSGWLIEKKGDTHKNPSPFEWLKHRQCEPSAHFSLLRLAEELLPRAPGHAFPLCDGPRKGVRLARTGSRRDGFR